MMFESGVLSKVVSEVAQGLGGGRLVEQRSAQQPQPEVEEQFLAESKDERREEADAKLLAYKKEFAKKVSKENYGGVDLFEGTTPLNSGGTPGEKQMGPMANMDPSDPGVDISGLLSQNGKAWKALAK